VDITRIKPRVGVAGVGTVCSAGDNSIELLDAIRRNQIALSLCDAYRDEIYMTNRVGAISAERWERIRTAAGDTYSSRTFALSRHALAEAVTQAEGDLAGIPRDRVGLVLSSTKAEVSAIHAPDDDAARRHIFPANLAADLAEAHDAHGPVQAVSVACISGLLAVQQGARLIQSGAADAVLVVGVDVLSHFVVAGFSTLRSLDPRGCRPFDCDRQGLSLGEAAAALVLTKKNDATSLASIAGWGVSNDANHLTGPSRDGLGLALAIRRALEMADMAPATIEHIHAHGTGTSFNDRTESLAIRTVFGTAPPPVSGSKGVFGHTLGAAGVIECALCVLSARAGVIPGTPGFSTPDQDTDVNVVSAPREGVAYRRILKINAGFGGTNSALVLEVNSDE